MMSTKIEVSLFDVDDNDLDSNQDTWASFAELADLDEFEASLRETPIIDEVPAQRSMTPTNKRRIEAVTEQPHKRQKSPIRPASPIDDSDYVRARSQTCFCSAPFVGSVEQSSMLSLHSASPRLAGD